MSSTEPQPVVNTDVARHRIRNAFTGPKAKMVALAALGGGAFLLGRKSRDVVEGVDVDIKTPDDSQN
jgi:hypothetical protein